MTIDYEAKREHRYESDIEFDDCITVKAAAAMIGVTPMTITQMVNKGKLQARFASIRERKLINGNSYGRLLLVSKSRLLELYDLPPIYDKKVKSNEIK